MPNKWTLNQSIARNKSYIELEGAKPG